MNNIARDVDAAGLVATAAVASGGEVALVAVAQSLAEHAEVWTRGIATDSRLTRLTGERVRVPFPVFWNPPDEDLDAVGDSVRAAFSTATGRAFASCEARLEIERQRIPTRANGRVAALDDFVVVDEQPMFRGNSPWHARSVAACLASATSVVRVASTSPAAFEPPDVDAAEASWMLEFGRLVVVQNSALLATISSPGDILASPAPSSESARHALREIGLFRRSEARARALAAVCPSLSDRIDLARLCVRIRLAGSTAVRTTLAALVDTAPRTSSSESSVRTWCDILAYLLPPAPLLSSDTRFLTVTCREKLTRRSVEGPLSVSEGPYIVDCYGDGGSASLEFETGADAAVAINALESVHDLIEA